MAKQDQSFCVTRSVRVRYVFDRFPFVRFAGESSTTPDCELVVRCV